MTDYISRDAAVELLSQPITMSMCLSVEECHNKIAQQRIDRYLVENIPAADVRPVVLCRDCVHCVESDEADGEKMCVIDADWCVENGCYYGFTAPTLPDWFCARGKKREES